MHKTSLLAIEHCNVVQNPSIIIFTMYFQLDMVKREMPKSSNFDKQLIFWQVTFIILQF